MKHRATVQALRITAQRALAAHQEAKQLGKELGTLAQPGGGPVAGAAPIQASSGQVVRHRLNPGR